MLKLNTFLNLLIMSVVLQGCSYVCTVREKPKTSSLVVVESYVFFRDKETSNFYSELRNQCSFISGYSSGVGTAIPFVNDAVKLFRTNGSRECLLKKAKNDAVTEGGNLVTSSLVRHPEDISIYIAAYKCNNDFLQKAREFKKDKQPK